MPHVLGDDFAKCQDRFPGSSPFGEDIKYDPVYQDLRAEVQKLTAMSSLDGGLDWKSVKKWSLDILGGKSKDLTVASYLTLSLFYLDGYGGLADGLAILHKLLKEDWEGMFPPSARPRNRALALEWLVTRLAPFLEVKAPRSEEAPLLPALREQLAAVQETVRMRLMHDAPSFGELNSALASHLTALPPPPPPAADGSAAAITEPLPDAAPAPVSVSAPAQPAIAPGTPADEVADRIRALIPALRLADPFSPAPYRLLRVLKWDPVTALPPVDGNGSTRIPPPRAQQRATLEGLYAARNWAALLEASETAFQDPGGTFWLDLQRYTATALAGLDPQTGPKAAEAVKEEVARLVKRLGGLSTLFFADRTLPAPPGRPLEKTIERTPFASDDTREWLQALQAGAGSEPETVFLPPARAVESAEPSLSTADARTAQDLLARGQVGAAFDLLQAAVEKTSGQRARFRTRLAAARLCFQANQPAWARHLLEELLQESEAFHFEDWEPETAADLYQLLALCHARPAKKGGPADPEAARARIEALRRKLFGLDLRAAAALEEALRK